MLEHAKPEKGYESWSYLKLRRKISQHWEMASLARMDRDEIDALRHTQLAKLYEETLRDSPP